MFGVRILHGYTSIPSEDPACILTPQNSSIVEQKSLKITRHPPCRIIHLHPGAWFIDFGKAVFGTVEISLNAPDNAPPMRVHLAETLAAPMKVDRNPGGTVRYRAIQVPLQPGFQEIRVIVPPDERNTGSRAIKMPTEIGEVMPFRYCEIEGYPGELTPDAIGQLFVHLPFDENAATFESSDPILNSIWELCRHTIKATTFCGVYVDGDRERIPYEGDVYINQLSHYALDAQYGIGRASLLALMKHATWPTEWHLHLVLIAWYDFLYSGDETVLREHYELLKLKTLTVLAGDDGLISTRTGKITKALLRDLGMDDFFKAEQLRDLVDWPQRGFAHPDLPGETDDYVFTDINTVVNTLHYRTLVLMERIAIQVGHEIDARFFRERAQLVAESINAQLFDTARGVYVDGVGTTHAAQHANAFALMAGVVPTERIASVSAYIKTRGMACSVYGAQHLLDGLYKAGESSHALGLMTATTDRSWYHMQHVLGSTMTLEAWDPKYKPNLDWNHAWGTAPANIIVRRLLGVRPGSPGFNRAIIEPQLGGLKWVRARIPTPNGPVELELWHRPGAHPALACELPENMKADVHFRRTGNTPALNQSIHSGSLQRID